MAMAEPRTRFIRIEQQCAHDQTPIADVGSTAAPYTPYLLSACEIREAGTPIHQSARYGRWQWIWPFRIVSAPPTICVPHPVYSGTPRASVYRLTGMHRTHQGPKRKGGVEAFLGTERGFTGN